MMGRGRLRAAQVEPARGHLALAREAAHDAPPDRVGESVQDGGQIELRRARMRQRLHVSPLPELFDNCRTSLYDDHRTYVREPSYITEGFVDHSCHSVLGSRAHRRIALHDHAGQPDRALDAPGDAARSRGVPRSAAVGRRHLHPHVRGPDADRRRAGRPLRPSSHARRRAARVHGRLRRGRPLQRPQPARRRARRPGPRRRAAHAAHADAAVSSVPGGAPYCRARPLLGGVIVETLDWHWIFWINVPVGLAAAALAPRRLTESRGAQVRLDLPGLAFASGGLLGIVWATTRGNADGWTAPSTLLAYAIGALLLGAFVLQERRSAAPMLPLGLFRRPGFAAANGAGFGLHFTMFAAFFLIIQYLTQVHGDSAIQAGVETLPWTLMPLALSPFTGSLGGRIGSRPFVVAGLLLLAAGTAGSALAMGVGSSYAELVVPLLAIGVGIAVVLPNVASAALGSALPEHIGKASGTNSTFRQLGSVFGIAVAVLVFDRAGSYASPEAVVDGARAALFVAAAVGALGAVAALGIPARPG